MSNDFNVQVSEEQDSGWAATREVLDALLDDADLYGAISGLGEGSDEPLTAKRVEEYIFNDEFPFYLLPYGVDLEEVDWKLVADALNIEFALVTPTKFAISVVIHSVDGLDRLKSFVSWGSVTVEDKSLKLKAVRNLFANVSSFAAEQVAFLEQGRLT